MNRKFLIMLGAICGAVIIVTVLFIPMAGEGEYSRNFVEGGSLAIWLSLFGILAAIYAALLFVGKTSLLGLDEARANAYAMLMFGLGAFFGLAMIIADSKGTQFGFWLYWIACLAGTFLMVLAANPALAQKIADAAKSDEKPAEDKPPEDKPAE